MLSVKLQAALRDEIVEQRRAIDAVIRAVSVAASGLDRRETPAGLYLFLGPRGTGKTHLPRTLARLLHGDERRLAVIDCFQIAVGEEWSGLVRQLAPHFRHTSGDRDDQQLATAPLTVLLFEHLERLASHLVPGLVQTLAGGRFRLPEGKVGSLGNSIVLLTGDLCAMQLTESERKGIGFSPAAGEMDESERARIYRLYLEAVENRWGPELVAHLDDLVVFHALRPHQLKFIVQRQLRDLNRELTRVGVTCELDEDAERFLAERGARFLQHGAWPVVKLFRRFVVFPVADIVTGGGVPRGSRLFVSRHDDDSLAVRVESADPVAEARPAPDRSRIPVRLKL